MQAMLNQQGGNTLIISLVLLLTLTIVGVSSTTGVSLNQRMASNFRDSDLAFQAAEAALTEGERLALRVAEAFNQTTLAHIGPTCGTADCFQPGCVDGLCFDGSYDPVATCDLQAPHPNPATDEETWTTDGVFRESAVNYPGLVERPKFIVEFLCYIPVVDPVPAFPGQYDPGSYRMHFRVSSYAIGASGNSEIVLQSTLQIPF